MWCIMKLSSTYFSSLYIYTELVCLSFYLGLRNIYNHFKPYINKNVWILIKMMGCTQISYTKSLNLSIIFYICCKSSFLASLIYKKKKNNYFFYKIYMHIILENHGKFFSTYFYTTVFITVVSRKLIVFFLAIRK